MAGAAFEVRGAALRGRVKDTWAALTDDDLHRLETSRSQFVGQVQERYGLSREAVERTLQELEADTSAV